MVHMLYYPLMHISESSHIGLATCNCVTFNHPPPTHTHTYTTHTHTTHSHLRTMLAADWSEVRLDHRRTSSALATRPVSLATCLPPPLLPLTLRTERPLPQSKTHPPAEASPLNCEDWLEIEHLLALLESRSSKVI